MPEHEKNRLRQPTLKLDADVFRKQFSINEFHKIVKKDSKKEEDPDQPQRAFDSYGLPNWTMPWKPTKAGIFNKSVNDTTSLKNINDKISSADGAAPDL